MSRWTVGLVLGVVALGSPARADDVRRDPPPAPTPTGVVTKTPRLLQASAPEYPAAALAAGKTAAVKVRLHLDATGVVTAVDVVAPVGDGFDEAATAAAEQYVFEPAEIDGAPGAIVVETTINFVIEQAPEPPPRPPPPIAHDQPPAHAGSMAQAVTLSGTVLERGTRRPLPGVIVSVRELGLDAITDEGGGFYFHGVAAGAYHVLAVDPAFEAFERPIAIGTREALEARLWLRPRGGDPYETVVEGEREVLEVTRRRLERPQLTSVPGTFGDPIRVIQTLPGLARTPFGLGLLLVRGSNPQDTGIFLDGHEVPSLFHFLGGPSIFNAEMLASMDLYPGGFPARFGRHHGGVVALESRPTTGDGVHGSAKVDFLDAGGYLRAPITRDLSFAIAGRRSYVDAFLGLVVPDPGNGASRVVAPIYQDFQGRLDYDLHAEGRLSLLAIGSGDSLRVITKDPDAAVTSDLSSAVRFFRVIGTYERRIGDELRLTLSPGFGRDEVTFAGAQAESAGPFTSIDISQTALSYRMRVHGKLGAHVTLDTGADVESRVTSYRALIPLDDNIRNRAGVDVTPSLVFRGAEQLATALYLDLGLDLGARLRLIPSLRLDGDLLDGQARGSIDPRLVARYRLDDGWTVKAYAGQFSQPPQPETFDHRFGNPAIGLEHGLHFGTGAEWRPDRVWSLDAEAYYIDRRDIVVFTSDLAPQPDGTYQAVNFRNSGHRDAYGFEALIKRDLTAHAYGWLSYTFSRAHQQSKADGAVTATTFDQPHVLNAVASWKPGAGWELGARFRMSSGRPDTPIIGATFNADTGTYAPVRGETRSIRTPLFHQLDLRAERTWLFETWSLGAYLDIQNVYNRQNVEAVQWDYRYKQSSPVTSFPFLPTLGVRGQW
jgi:TonB family protein